MYFLKKQETVTKISTYIALFFIGLFMISLIAFGQELININRASKTKLDTLPGIGPAYAQRIIDGRPYHKKTELLDVRGIGEKTFENIKDLVTIGSGPTAIFGPENDDKPESENSSSGNIHKVSEENPVDINHASQKQLQLLPGIGPAYSGRIINQRPFLDKNNLLEVKGIGEKTLEDLKPLIVINLSTSDSAPPDKPLDINSASFEELTSVPGIGANKAKAIIDNRPYRTFDELVNLAGLASSSIGQLKNFLKIDSEAAAVYPLKKKAVLWASLKKN